MSRLLDIKPDHDKLNGELYWSVVFPCGFAYIQAPLPQWVKARIARREAKRGR